MTLTEVLNKCSKFGEFYLYLRGVKKGAPYLQGTLEFDKYTNKFSIPEKPEGEVILVFSRTNNCFRYIEVSKIKKVTSLNEELDKKYDHKPKLR